MEKIHDNKGFRGVFITTFGTVFIAELGDKTQIATLLLTAQSAEPFVVFIAASTALISSSLVGVLIGRWLANIVSPERFNYFAGLLMVSVGVLIGVQAMNSILHKTISP